MDLVLILFCNILISIKNYKPSRERERTRFDVRSLVVLLLETFGTGLKRDTANISPHQGGATARKHHQDILRGKEEKLGLF